ncbi:hypothetical protein HN873_024114 [Arachis hypogaea]
MVGPQPLDAEGVLGVISEIVHQAVRKGQLDPLPRIPDEEILGEPPTPTTVHVRSLLDLTNYPSYLLYVLDSPSLS